jgi:hypothetical protein
METLQKKLLTELLKPLDINQLPKNDLYAIDFLLKHFKLKKKINTYIVIKYYLFFCDFTSELNSLETEYYAALESNSKELNMCFNITQMIYNFVNEYTLTYVEHFSDKTAKIIKNLGMIEFDLTINQTIIEKIRSSHLAQYYKHLTDDELSENIKYTIKLCALHRCALFTIHNKARKDEEGLLEYTKGNTVVFNREIINKIQPLLVLEKQPILKPKKLKYKNCNTIADLIENKNFSYNI